MSGRRNFLRDVAMTIAVSLLPKILQPAVPEVQEDEIEPVQLNMFVCAPEGYEHLGNKTYWMPKEDVEKLKRLGVYREKHKAAT